MEMFVQLGWRSVFKSLGRFQRYRQGMNDIAAITYLVVVKDTYDTHGTIKLILQYININLHLLVAAVDRSNRDKHDSLCSPRKII